MAVIDGYWRQLMGINYRYNCSHHLHNLGYNAYNFGEI